MQRGARASRQQAFGITARAELRHGAVVGRRGEKGRRRRPIDPVERGTAFGFQAVQLAAEHAQHRRTMRELLLHAHHRIKQQLEIGTPRRRLRECRASRQITAETIVQQLRGPFDILLRKRRIAFGQTVLHHTGGDAVCNEPFGEGNPLVFRVDLTESAARTDRDGRARHAVRFEKQQRTAARLFRACDRFRCRHLPLRSAAALRQIDLRQFHLHLILLVNGYFSPLYPVI